jgi:hypothetical protein
MSSSSEQLRQSRYPHVDPLTAKRHALSLEQPALSSSLRKRPVRADDPMPWHGRIVARMEYGSGQAGSARRDVAVGADETGRSRPDAVENLAFASQVHETQSMTSRRQSWYRHARRIPCK